MREDRASNCKEENMLTLTDRDRDLFLAALENPPEPNNNLKKAFLDYIKDLGELYYTNP